jgi:hypothetical protein
VSLAEPTDPQMWRAVEATIRNVVLPSITDDWARVAAVQLVGMARYAQVRPDDPVPARVAELRGVLERLAANPIVAAHRPQPDPSDGDVMATVGAVLADAVGRDDAPADEVRAQLRPVVRRQLDDDLASSGMLMPYFRGELPDA